MDRIVAPVDRGTAGLVVQNLQEALLLLLRKSVIRGDLPRLEEALKAEQQDARYGDFTGNVVALFQEQTRERFGLPRTEVVDASTADALNQVLAEAGAFGAPPRPPAFTVRGRVTSAGLPAAGIAVIAADMDVRSMQSLGPDPPARSDAEGNYLISYGPEGFTRADKGSADLVFTLLDAAGNRIRRFTATSETGQPLKTIQVRSQDPGGDPTVDVQIAPNAAPDTIVNFDIAIGEVTVTSEYDRLLAMLDPLLVNVLPASIAEPTVFDRLADLGEQDLDFLTLETSVDRGALEHLAVAVRLARDLFGNDLSPAIFYALARTLGTTDVPRLARKSVAALRNSLMRTGGVPGQPGDNTIPVFASQELLDGAANLIHNVATERSLTTAVEPTQASLSQVLAVALPAPEQQQALVRAFANRTGSVPRFWQDLRKLPDFQAPGVIENTQFALQVGAFADDKPSLIAQIQATTKYRSMRHIALDMDQVGRLALRMEPEELAEVPGATHEARAANYARQLASKLKFAFPTETLALTIGKLGLPEDEKRNLGPVADFLLKASDPASFAEGEAFSVRGTHIDTFIRRNGARLFGDLAQTQQQVLIAGAKRVQRLFNVSTSPETFAALMQSGIGSAQQIAAIPKTVFVDRFKDTLGGAETAEYMHRKSTAIGLAATEMAISVYQAHRDVQPAVTGGGIKQLPSWAELFGSVELCECAHCGSVLGPAAYFVDLLQFLRQSKRNAAGFTPLDFLIGSDAKNAPPGRRPDLAYLQLNCENTDTVLPYVDLVNEVLESYIVQGGTATKDAAHDVGKAASNELLANPQYVSQEAYKALSDAVYPPRLPFDRSLAAVRQYLQALQTTRLDLLCSMVSHEAQAWSPPIVAECLGLGGASEYEILTGRLFDGTASALDLKRVYGFPESGTTSVGELVQQQSVRDLLTRTALEFTELVEVLEAQFVNPARTQLRTIENIGLTEAEVKTIVESNFTTIPPSAQRKLDAAGHTVQELQQWLQALDGLSVLFSRGSACDLDETRLQRRDGAALDDAFFVRLQRFIRLRRALGWTVADLDSALRARMFGADPVAGIRDLAQMHEIIARTEMAVPAVLALWSPLETHGDGSPFRKLFEDRAVSSPPDPVLALDATEDEIDAAQRANPPLLSDKKATLFAAIRLREAEFATIAADANLGASAALNLANLSSVYRYVALSRGAGIPLRLLVELRRLSAADPFSTPGGTLAFLDVALRIQAINLSQPQLAYWCRHADTGNLTGAGVRRQASDLNTKLLSGLQKLADDAAALLTGPSTEQLQNELALLIRVPADLHGAVEVVEGRSKLSGADRRSFMDVQFAQFLDSSVRTQLLPDVVIDPNDPNAPRAAEEERIRRRVLVLHPLLDFLKRDFVRQAVADSVGITPDFQPLLLDRAVVLHALAAPSRPLLDDFMTPSTALGDPLLGAFTRLMKAVGILSSLGISADELAHFAANAADFGGLDLNALPLAPVDGRSVFSFVDALATYVELRARVGKASVPLIRCFAAADATARATAIALLLDVDVSIVDEAIKALALTDGSVRTSAGLRVVVDLIHLAATVGARPSAMATWAGPPTTSIADALRDTLKAKYDTQSWLSAARTVSDALRESQRAALVAYVVAMDSVAKLGIRDANQLFEHFLIDVQMSPCMLTSRIKQAISSVQLFVDRCLLNLEQAIAPDAIDLEQWGWRKNYRVWEANRKVFLYPENWIEPELRDDKSPFFKELEAELLQTDVTDDSAQAAIGSYLAKLDEVARLEVCGVYLETGFDDPSRSVLHVIARNLTGAPRKYFYRRLVDDTSWTPWEKVDVEIQSTEDKDASGAQVLPVVWNRRLYLFWLSFAKKSDAPTLAKIEGGNVDLSEQQPASYWEIKINWSLYENGRWMQKRLSSATVDYPPNDMLRIHVPGRGVKVVKLQSVHVRADPGSCRQFKLKAPASGASLELLVVRNMTERVGAFSLRDRHGDMVSTDASGAEIELLLAGGEPQFMGVRSSQALRLQLPSTPPVKDSDIVAVLNASPTPLRLLSAAQFSPASLETPHFLDLPEASYFLRSRPQWVWSADYHNRPNHVFPDHVQRRAFSEVRSDVLAPQAMSRAASLSSGHPWTVANAALSSTAIRSAPGAGRGLAAAGADTLAPLQLDIELRFDTAFHPYANEFVRRLNYQGIGGLLGLDTQALGNPYLREPWRAGYTIEVSSGNGVSLIEGSFGRDAGNGRPGNFELIVREGPNDGSPRDLRHYFHDSGNLESDWQPGLLITDKAIAGGCLIERVSGPPGTFELVVPQADGLAHYSRFASNLEVWQPNDSVPVTTKHAVSLIESDYLTAGTSGARCLELFVVEGGQQSGKRQLSHYRLAFVDPNRMAWQRQAVVCTDVTGPACAIQSSFAVDGHGRFEVLVLERNPLSRTTQRLVHYWKDESVKEWQRGLVITDKAIGSASLIQSEVSDSAKHGNFEVLVQEGSQLVHYWRDNSRPGQFWHRGQIVTTRAGAPGCLIASHFGAPGNFEVVVPEGTVLKHYFHVNGGPVGSGAQRFYFGRAYGPTQRAIDPYPRHDVDFRFGTPYSLYNWELFFHVPMMIAMRLFRNQRYADARKWMHHIFNPTIDSTELTTHRFWQVLPLRDTDRTRIDQMLEVLSSGRPEDAVRRAEVEQQIADWERNPFQPHRIARMRLGAYKKNVVFKYLDIVLAEGDRLFRQDTIEAINEATQRYVMAANILGPRPQIVPETRKRTPRTYHDLVTAPDGLDKFSNALVEVENEFPYSSMLPPVDGSDEAAGLLGVANVLYFCVPKNDKLLGYWDTVEDRLYKIRHCMNIQGVVRQLPLFEPPIDPAMLVQAAAQGMPLASALADLSAPLPYYRFSYTLQKALELCGDLKSLGAQLLATLEKKDAEKLAATRATQEAELHRLVKMVRDLQVTEAIDSVNALIATRHVTLARYQHYHAQLGADKQKYAFEPAEGAHIKDFEPSKTAELVVNDDTGVKLIRQEGDELEFAHSARDWQVQAGFKETLASLMHYIPQIHVSLKPLGIGGEVVFGGDHIGPALSAWGRYVQNLSAQDTYDASRSAKLGSLIRREQDWTLQFNLAARELMQIDKQLVAARRRVDIALREQFNQQTQIGNSAEIELFLRTKFSNTDLYSWMVGEIGTLYAQAYELAYDAAKRAERCYRFERGLTQYC